MAASMLSSHIVCRAATILLVVALAACGPGDPTSPGAEPAPPGSGATDPTTKAVTPEGKKKASSGTVSPDEAAKRAAKAGKPIDCTGCMDALCKDACWKKKKDGKAELFADCPHCILMHCQDLCFPQKGKKAP